jgi:hypothetical protein
MGCERITINGVSGFICGRGRRPAKCFYCNRNHKYLCDYPVELIKSGKNKGKWKTCDMKLCDEHTRKGKSLEVDFCPKHYELAKQAYERRLLKEQAG